MTNSSCPKHGDHAVPDSEKLACSCPKVQVVRVGIGRLYNLGNYEHIRYDLTIEIPKDVDVMESV